MRLESLELLHVKLPLNHFFQTSFGKFYERNLVILKGESNMGVVYGEAPSLIGPFYTYETTLTTLHIIKDFLSKKILKKDFEDINSVHEAMNFVRGHNIAKSGIDTLFYNIKSLELNKSLSKTIGGTRSFIESGVSLGIQNSINDLLIRIQDSLDQGFKRIKIKVKKGWDIEVLKQVRDAFPSIKLMVDANSSYTLKDINLLKKFDKYDLIMIEQPLGFNDILDHAKLQKEINTPICLDESIHTVDHARHAIELNACKIINIKIARVGGVYPAIKIHDLCKENGMPVWCGGMLESGVGQAFAIAIASLPNFSLPGDVAPSNRYFKEDLIKPLIRLDKGRIIVPTSPGLGFEVDEEKIKKYLVNTIKIS